MPKEEKVDREIFFLGGQSAVMESFFPSSLDLKGREREKGFWTATVSTFFSGLDWKKKETGHIRVTSPSGGPFS